MEGYEEAAARFQEELAGSPWNGNIPKLEAYGRREVLLADQYRLNLLHATSGTSYHVYDYRQEVLKALDEERASAEDMIAASVAFRGGQDSIGSALLEKAAERKQSQITHLERARQALKVAIVMHKLQYLG